MIAETLLACWLIACVFLPLLWALTSSPPSEVRRVTNALVVGQAERLIRAGALRDRFERNFPEVHHWRAAVEPTLTGIAPVWALEESDS